jgi:conjugal transfer pilus assembly protein TraV
MQKRSVIFGFLLAMPILLSGCFLNPYSSDFSCPRTANGKCVSVSEAYEASLSSKGSTTSDSKKDHSSDIAGSFEAEYFRKLSSLLKEPVTPMVKPASVQRILFLPYTGQERELYMYRFAFFFTDDPSWIMGDYLDAGSAELE